MTQHNESPSDWVPSAGIEPSNGTGWCGSRSRMRLMLQEGCRPLAPGLGAVGGPGRSIRRWRALDWAATFFFAGHRRGRTVFGVLVRGKALLVELSC